MNFPIFASFILFCVLLTLYSHYSRSESEKKTKAFWEKENRANNTRKQSLDSLSFIHIPFETLPVIFLEEEHPDALSLSEYYQDLHSFDSLGMVNFQGQSNTDLKLRYGVGNLETLILYEQHYSDCLIALDHIAKILSDAGYEKEAIQYLEYAIAIHSDLSSTYKLLAQLYKKNQMTQKIDHLKTLSNTLTDTSKLKIQKLLEEYS